MMISLAIKYRPKTWDDVVEQSSTKTILQQQLESNSIKNAYLFCGGAGTGKTTCARIFANEINNGHGNPIELDAASNNSVDDVREIIQQAKTKSLDSEYKIFILDEVHALSNSAWQAMLKLIEEPPAKSIFIFCTTNPERIPKTILSRVQRYDFNRISTKGIVKRLDWICANEEINNPDRSIATMPALEYIAKLADGGCRDAITMLDKCLAYSKDLTIENVVKALGVANYSIMEELTDGIIQKNAGFVVEKIEQIHADGIDLKQFTRQYLNFIIDVNKYLICGSFDCVQIPDTEGDEAWLESVRDNFDTCQEIMDTLMQLNAEMKWDSSPKYITEARLMKLCL